MPPIPKKPVKSIAESIQDDPEVLEQLEANKRLMAKYEPLSEEATAFFRAVMAQTQTSGKKTLQSSDLSDEAKCQTEYRLECLATAETAVEQLLASRRSPVEKFIIVQTANWILSSAFDLSIALPEVRAEAKHERDRRGGRGRAKQLREEADQRWRNDALKFFSRWRRDVPSISQERLADEFIETRGRKKARAPGHQTVVNYIRSCQNDGRLARSTRRHRKGMVSLAD